MVDRCDNDAITFVGISLYFYFLKKMRTAFFSGDDGSPIIFLIDG